MNNQKQLINSKLISIRECVWNACGLLSWDSGEKFENEEKEEEDDEDIIILSDDAVELYLLNGLAEAEAALMALEDWHELGTNDDDDEGVYDEE